MESLKRREVIAAASASLLAMASQPLSAQQNQNNNNNKPARKKPKKEVWVHKHSKDPQVIVDFVNSMKPHMNGIRAGLSHGVDFHVWVRQGDNDPRRYEIKHTGSFTSKTAQNIEVMLASQSLVFIGFNISSPTAMWYFEQLPR